MSEDKYSVIMTAFEGNWEKLDKAVPDIFGRAGLVTWAVAHPDELPSELTADVTRDEAERMAAKLEDFGAKVHVLPTAEVEGVQNRAGDLWYSKVTEHFAFTEIEEMIVTTSPMEAKRHLALIRQHSQQFNLCGFEDDFNHMHIAPFATGMSPRAAVREGNVIAGRLKHGLSVSYPNRRFIIYLDPGERITFCQAADDAPKEGKTLDRNPAKAWCQYCETMQSYRKRTEPDAEFPEADWGDCAVCGNEVLVAAPEALILVGPE